METSVLSFVCEFWRRRIVGIMTTTTIENIEWHRYCGSGMIWLLLARHRKTFTGKLWSMTNGHISVWLNHLKRNSLNGKMLLLLLFFKLADVGMRLGETRNFLISDHHHQDR